MGVIIPSGAGAGVVIECFLNLLSSLGIDARTESLPDGSIVVHASHVIQRDPAFENL